jgi:hypothetical protein
MVQAGRSRFRIPIRSLEFFNLPNLSISIMSLGLTRPLKGICTKNISGGEGIKCSRRVRLTISPPSMSRLSGNRDYLYLLGPAE